MVVVVHSFGNEGLAFFHVYITRLFNWFMHEKKIQKKYAYVQG